MTYVINRRKETAHRIRWLPFYSMNTQWLLCAIFLTFWNIFAQYSKSVLHFSPLCDKIVSTEPGQTTKKESLYLKGFLALLLVVVIAATALNITAFAYSDFNEGTYQGKHWTARQTVTKTSVDTTFSWPGEGTLLSYIPSTITKQQILIRNIRQRVLALLRTIPIFGFSAGRLIPLTVPPAFAE